MAGDDTLKYDLTIAAAVNSDETLATCLLASPEIDSVHDLHTLKGCSSAASAYNQAIELAQTDHVLLCHQDVYFPAGAIASIVRQIEWLNQHRADWAVAGVIGLDGSMELSGVIWSSGLSKVIGREVPQPVPTFAIDEMVILLRKSSGLRFDERLKGWHLYATDIIQEASAAGLTSWVVNAPSIHNSRPVIALDRSYRSAWRFVRDKWHDRLPIPNLVCTVEASEIRLWKKVLRYRFRFLARRSRGIDSLKDARAIATGLGWEE